MLLFSGLSFHLAPGSGFLSEAGVFGHLLLLDFDLADLGDCLEQSLAPDEVSRVVKLLLPTDALQQIFQLDKCLLDIVEKLFEQFLVLAKTGLKVPFDKIVVRLIDRLELIVVRNLFARVEPGLVIGGQPRRTLGPVNLFHYDIFQVGYCFAGLLR